MRLDRRWDLRLLERPAFPEAEVLLPEVVDDHAADEDSAEVDGARLLVAGHHAARCAWTAGCRWEASVTGNLRQLDFLRPSQSSLQITASL